MSQYAFLDPGSAYPLPRNFNFADYIETERELWALFPETEGKRVNFVQIGLTAQIYAEVKDTGEPLAGDETYILMPCADYMMRPLRMRSRRRLTLSEFRMAHLTAVKLAGKLNPIAGVMQQIGCRILGDEVLFEVQERMKDE